MKLPEREKDFDFIPTGPFYKKNKLEQSYLLLKKKLLAVNMFVCCLFDYKVSIKANELDIMGCWELCDSMMDARIGRTLELVWY